MELEGAGLKGVAAADKKQDEDDEDEYADEEGGDIATRHNSGRSVR